MKVIWIAAVAGLTAALGGTRGAAQQGSAQAACNFYQSGIQFMERESYAAALLDFQKVEACPDVNIRADALLQRGHTYLRMWPRQFGEARRITNTLTTGEYLSTPAAQSGFVLLGLIEIWENRNFQLALEHFERVKNFYRDHFERETDVFPPSDALAEAQFRTGEVHRIQRDPVTALRYFRDVTLRYPRTIWAARSLVGAASCHAQLGDAAAAMEALQRVRRDFRDRPEAAPEVARALERNTILHRLYMRGEQQGVQSVTAVGRTKFRDGAGLIFYSGQLVLGTRDGLFAFSTDKFEQLRAYPAGSRELPASAVGLAPGRIPALARDYLIIQEGRETPFVPEVPRDARIDRLEILSFISNWKGEWLVADRRTRAIHRFSAAGQHAGVFASNLEAMKMVQNDSDDFAVLDGRTRSVGFFTRDGKPSGGIPRRPATQPLQYEFDSPVDLSIDVLGNLYVLDGDRGVIHVFDPAGKFRTTLQLPVKGQGAIRKAAYLAVDDAGRLHVFDRDLQQILVYQ
jgi:tetratricopeptide (TPR) repeat protein